MKAALLKKIGVPLSIEEIANPVLGTGEIIVDVIATSILPYTKEVISGERNYLLRPPIVPGIGAIGRVKAKGPDATHLKVGDWVFCDPTVRSRDEVMTPDITLQGWSARGEGGLSLQEYYHHGPLAEQMLVPTENAIAIGDIEEEDAGSWCALSQFIIPYGGLLAIGLQAGETIVVSGATGNYGSTAVAVALAMGAGCVVAPGRNESALSELRKRFGNRIRTVKLIGNQKEDREQMIQKAPGPIDCVFDMLPPSAGPTAVRAAIMTLRENGRAVLMGGVGMEGGEDLELPYSWIMHNNITIMGQWMYPRSATTGMVKMIRSGLLDLNLFEIKEFHLDDVGKAIDFASKTKGIFKMTVVRP